MFELATFVSDFAKALEMADASCPPATNVRSKKEFLAGIGPHAEASALKLIAEILARRFPDRYGAFSLGVGYPSSPRKKCDLCYGNAPAWEWSMEVKLARLLGDNGKPNDNILMHILSPYPEHRSAVTDCAKLLASGLSGRKAILIYGFDHQEWSLDPAIDAFERLASLHVQMSQKCVAEFAGLVHPVHARGRVFGWELI